MRLLWLMLFLGCSGAVAARAAETNLLFIVVDDLGYGDLASYDHPWIQSPNLDKLAQTGIQFTSYYAPSALCSPSRAAMLTGRHPYRTGIESWIPADSGVYLRDEEVTLAELLRGEGYATALIGKWHLNSDLGNAEEPQPNDQGFDYFYGHNAFQTPTNRNPDNLFRNRQKLPVQKGYTAELYARESIEWLRGQSRERPFFLMLSMAEPHTPIENTDAMNAAYSRHTMGAIVPIPSGGPTPPKALLEPRGPGEYFANVTSMDRGIGQVIDYLEQANLRSSTLIIFVSDNGPVTDDWIHWYEVNAYGSTGGLRGRKHFLYEGGIKVPALLSQPGVLPEGARSDLVFSGTDWLATLSSLLGFDLPMDRAIDSVDISRVLLGDAPLSRSLHWALPTPNGYDYAIRDGKFKLSLDADQQPKALYDLEIDPLEMFNLLTEMPTEAQRLANKHRAFFEKIRQDPLRPK